MLAGIVQRLDAMQDVLSEIRAASARGLAIHGAALDASPVEPQGARDAAAE